MPVQLPTRIRQDELLNDHHTESHTVASHSDTSGTGAELNTLTDGSDADALHAHAIADTHIASSANPHSVDATDVGLGNVENTALFNLGGVCSNITTLGTIVTGVWSGTAIVDGKLASSYVYANGTVGR